MANDNNPPTTLTEALKTYRAKFVFENGKWCLFGTTSDGLGWETEDYPSASLDEAKAAALNYLIEYNS